VTSEELEKALADQLARALAQLAQRAWDRVTARLFGKKAVPKDRRPALGMLPAPIQPLDLADSIGWKTTEDPRPGLPDIDEDPGLTEEEQLRRDAALEVVGDLITNMADRTVEHFGAALTVADVREETAQAVEDRKTPRQLAVALRQASQDVERDWDRVSVTELQVAANEGRARAIRQQAGEDDPLVFKRPMPDACSWCVRLHIGPDGKPRLFRLATLEQDNRGRRKSEWKAVRGPTHPNCQCPLFFCPAGWGFDDAGDLVPDPERPGEAEEDLAKALELEDAHQRVAHLGGDVVFQDLQIRVEANAGDVRRWRCPVTGQRGETVLRFAYGEIVGTEGMDGDPVDVYLGPDPRAPYVYAVDQLKRDGSIDEQKLFLGFPSANAVEAAYKAHYPPEFYGTLTQLTVEDLITKLAARPHDGMIKADADHRRPRNSEDRGWDIRSNPGLPSAHEIKPPSKRRVSETTGQQIIADKRARARKREVVPVVDLTGSTGARHVYDPPSAAKISAAERTEMAEHNLSLVEERVRTRRKNTKALDGPPRVGSVLPSVPVDLSSG
jgi:hypothetical protein